MGKIIRQIIAGLLVATAVLLALVPADTAMATSTHGDFVYDGSTLVKYIGNEQVVTLPNDITEIGKDAFAGNTSVAKVVIPDSVRTIDFAAFLNCTNLQIVSMPQSVRTIGSSAFSGCKNLYSISIPDKCESIGSGVFAGCVSLADVPISANNRNYVCADGVIYTKDGSELVQYLPGRTFSTYQMPAAVSKIGEYAFWGSNMLTNVTVSKGVKEIPEYAFAFCDGLSYVTLPTSVESLRAYSFADCANLKRVSIPDSVGYIDDKAFYLTNGAVISFVSPTGQTVDVPAQNASAAGGSDFENADESVNEISEGTQSESIQQQDESLTDDNDDYDLYYHKSYSGDPTWKSDISSLDFEDNKVYGELGSTKIVGNSAVLLMSPDMPVRGYGINEAEIEDAIASTGNTTVSNALFPAIGGTLTEYNGEDSEIVIPDGNTRIGARAFYDNQNITKVTLPNDLSEIGDFAFARTPISGIGIPEGTVSIGYGAFYNCPNLCDVSFPSSLQTIELGAFDGTPYIRNFLEAQDNNNFLIVGDGILLAYKGEGGNISIPDTVRTIAPGCFEGNKTVTGVSFPDTVRTIGEDAFNGCSSLSSLNLNDGLTSIEDRAFCDTNLPAVHIPSSVSTIGLGAFDTTAVGTPLKTVLFGGTTLPDVSYKPTASRLSAQKLRSDAFEGVENAIVNGSCDISSGSIADPMHYGFHGQIYSIASDSLPEEGHLDLIASTKQPDENGMVIIDPHVNIANMSYIMTGVKNNAFDNYLNWKNWCDRKPVGVEVSGNASEDLDKLMKSLVSNIDNSQTEDKMTGVKVNLDGGEWGNPDLACANIPGYEDEALLLNVAIDERLRDSINRAFECAYGVEPDSSLIPLNIRLSDSTGTIDIHKLGESMLEVTLPMPSKFNGAVGVKAASLDENGALYELPTESLSDESGEKVRFIASHCSTFCLYVKSYSYNLNTEVEQNVLEMPGYEAGQADVYGYVNESLGNTANIGVLKTLDKSSNGINAKWFVIAILLLTAGVLILYRPGINKKKRR